MSEKNGERTENCVNIASISDMELPLQEANRTAGPNHLSPFLSRFLVADDNIMKRNEFVTKLIFRLLLSILIFFLSLYLQGLLIYVSDMHYHTGAPALKDRVHEIFGPDPPVWAPASFVNVLCAAYIAMSLIRFTLFVDWKFSFTIVTRFFLSVSFLYLLRGIAISVTTLPSPIPSCVPLRSTGFFATIKGVVLMTIGIKYGCTDLVISGHTLFITSLTIIWIHYSVNSKFSMAALLSFYLLILLCIDVSFFHYTVDIFMGICFAIATWMLYHFLLDIAAMDLKRRLFPTSQGSEDFIVYRYPLLRPLSLFLGKLEGLEYRIRFFIDTEYSKWIANKLSPVQTITLSEKSFDYSLDNVMYVEEGAGDMLNPPSKSEFAQQLLCKPKIFTKVYFGDGQYCCDAIFVAPSYIKAFLEKLWQRFSCSFH
ncbi:hypothetical protein IE077_001211 [Cardiosporidium cionae]|uniref:Sphingomyelin synthase-like domain-containing protein n=1 Tax=Cardiosporidium cionae TaxID=476202 RepID=A0ABQ7J5U3_9APIC|nr:hypothetical protein IE077_001211 [Cardiosporidium cionae]|eukprot:KAF8819299.1 hypothetical protein IE077_001211 [Cardiosporidium cionae]